MNQTLFCINKKVHIFKRSNVTETHLKFDSKLYNIYDTVFERMHVGKASVGNFKGNLSKHLK